MVELVTVLGYLLSFGIPALIIGYGSMIEEYKASIILSFINMVSLLAYFFYIGAIPGWILVLVLVLISLLFVVLYTSILGGSNG